MGRRDECLADPDLRPRVACVGDDDELRFGPCLVQVPSRAHGTHDVVAPLHDDRGDVADLLDSAQELIVLLEEAAVDEVVCFDACERIGELTATEALHRQRVDAQFARRALPDRPRERRLLAHGGVLAGEPLVVRTHHVAAFALGNGLLIGIERVGEEVTCALLVEPEELAAPQEEDPAQHQRRDALRVGLCVREREGAPPAPAEHGPGVDAEVLAEALDVGDQVPGRVLAQLGVRRALATAPLVEEHDAPALRIEVTPVERVDASARSAVQEHERLAVGRTALFVV